MMTPTRHTALPGNGFGTPPQRPLPSTAVAAVLIIGLAGGIAAMLMVLRLYPLN
ncbi:hypothetical protein [Zoogloea sp.]|uniref:hypothetical protein n=1 Tax=Zoogloea sp. TaxID=49181 RepID=UPI00261F1205|nr:hypothetical protein [Zoogloea sp.]